MVLACRAPATPRLGVSLTAAEGGTPTSAGGAFTGDAGGPRAGLGAGAGGQSGWTLPQAGVLGETGVLSAVPSRPQPLNWGSGHRLRASVCWGPEAVRL